MNLKEYARAIRFQDWTACMSDDYRAVRRGRESRKKLASLASESKNHARLWELGSKYHGNLTWNGKNPEQRWEDGWRWAGAYLWAHGVRLTEQRWEDGWRWAGAYLWAHGVRLTEEEAQNLVHKGSGDDDAGDIKWAEVTNLIKEA